VTKGQRLLIYDNVELGEAIGQYLADGGARKDDSQADVAKRALERARIW